MAAHQTSRKLPKHHLSCLFCAVLRVSHLQYTKYSGVRHTLSGTKYPVKSGTSPVPEEFYSKSVIISNNNCIIFIKTSKAFCCNFVYCMKKIPSLCVSHHLKNVKFQVVSLRHIPEYRVVGSLLARFDLTERNMSVKCCALQH